MNDKRGVNRRLLMKGVAGGAVVPGMLAGSAFMEGGATAPPEATVAVTVVRATHSLTDPDALRIGVRASIRSADFSRDGLVLVVEPVAFGGTSAETGSQIAEGVRAQVATMLTERGRATDPERVAVQVFGGML